jgi:hypothetical protein
MGTVCLKCVPLKFDIALYVSIQLLQCISSLTVGYVPAVFPFLSLTVSVISYIQKTSLSTILKSPCGGKMEECYSPVFLDIYSKYQGSIHCFLAQKNNNFSVQRLKM